MKKRSTKKIRIWGIVQGVGFRPFVAKLAERLCMKGKVRNLGGIVEICVTDTAERIAIFISEIEKEKRSNRIFLYRRADHGHRNPLAQCYRKRYG